MKKLFDLLIFVLFSIPAYFVREFIQKNKVTILVYHSISYKLFEKHLELLSKKYSFISFQDFIKWKKDESYKTSLKPIIFTFDDGAKDIVKLIPLFEKYSIKPTIFLILNAIGLKWYQWRLVNNNKISKEEAKDLSFEEAIALLKVYKLDTEQKRDYYSFLDKDDIKNNIELMDFQSHGVNHEFLPYLSETEKDFEISHSKACLEVEYGLNINKFCYPFGFYTDDLFNYLINNNYDYAVTVDNGSNNKSVSPFKIKRISFNNCPLWRVHIQASGLYDFLKLFVINYENRTKRLFERINNE